MSRVDRTYIRIVLTIVGLVVITATVIGLVSYAGSRQAATNLARQIQTRIFLNVKEKFNDFMNLPHALNRINAGMIARDPSVLDDLDTLGMCWLRQLQAFDSIQNIAVGVEEQGNFVGSGRSEGSGFTVALRTQSEEGAYRLFRVDQHGNRTDLLHKTPDYDARTRPWYQAAVEAGQAAWSPLYIWSSGTSIGLTATLPITTPQGELLGIQQTALSLDFISRYLKTMAADVDTQVFLLEPDGLLVASSVAKDMIREGTRGFERVRAADSEDPFTREAAAYLVRNADIANGLTTPLYASLTVDGRRYFLAAARLPEIGLQGGRELDWILVTGLPEASVLSGIHAAQRYTLGISIVATLAAVLLGIVIARQLAAANQRLRESEERLNSTGRFARVGGWEVDARTLGVKWTEALFDLHEMPVGQPPALHEAIHSVYPEDQAVLSAATERALELGEPYDLELRMVTAKGNPVWVRTVCRPEFEAGRVLRLKGFYQDISARKQAEEKLLKSEQMFRELAELAPVQITILTVEQEAKYLYVNRRWEEEFGYTKAEAVTLAPIKLVHPEMRQLVMENARKRLTGQDVPDRYEMKLLTRSGETRIVDFAATLIDYETQKAILTAAVDITQRKAAEARLQMTIEQLRTANADKARLFSIIGHDLRSPLAAVMNATQMLQVNVASMPGEMVAKMAAGMHASMGNVFELLDDLLAWSRISQDHITFSPRHLDLWNLTEAGLRVPLETAKRKGVAILNNVRPGLYADVDENMFHTILRNLVGNAVKFTPSGGTITITATEQDDTIIITVQDDGVGMNAETVDNLFVDVTKSMRKGTGGESGTGLGLRICKEFVERHGGRISVESAPGRGTSFRFSLPTKPVPPQETVSEGA